MLLLIRALLNASDGAMGFNELGRQIGAHPPILASRLELLERHGIVIKQVTSQMPPRSLYRLSSAGLALQPVFTAIETWATMTYKFLPVPESKPQNKTQLSQKSSKSEPNRKT